MSQAQTQAQDATQGDTPQTTPNTAPDAANAPAPAPRKMGRPSDYRPEYCAQVVEFGKRGESLVQFAAAVDQGRNTIYRWQDEHPEFREACARAQAHAQAWWERVVQKGIKSRDFNVKLAELVLRSRFRDDYGDQVNVSVKYEGMVHVKTLSNEELLALARPVIETELVEAGQPASLPAPEPAAPATAPEPAPEPEPE